MSERARGFVQGEVRPIAGTRVVQLDEAWLARTAQDGLEFYYRPAGGLRLADIERFEEGYKTPLANPAIRFGVLGWREDTEVVALLDDNFKEDRPWRTGLGDIPR